MDLSQTEVGDEVDCIIVDRNGDQTDAVFILAGPGHPQRVAFERKLSARSLREFNRKGKMQLPDDPDDIFDNETTRLVALTLGWRNVTNGSGEPIPFTADAARVFYENRRSNVRAQVSKALADIANFTPGLSTN